MLMCVGAALRVGEASLFLALARTAGSSPSATRTVPKPCICGCSANTRAAQARRSVRHVPARSAPLGMRAARPDAKPDDPLFLENHREGIKELLTKANLRTDQRAARATRRACARPDLDAPRPWA
jgi:hypothetical protein